MNETLTGALERQTQTPKARNVLDLLEAQKPQIRRLLGTDEAAERFARIVLTEVRRSQLLQECEPYSFLGAVMQVAQLDLEPGPLGLVYLVPFKREVTLIVGYRGFVELAYRTGRVRSIVGRLVHDGDTFRVSLGTSERIVHEPAGAPGEREIVSAYAVAKLATGGTVSQVIYPDDWERSRMASPSGRKDSGPWVTDRAAMIRKTAVRRLEPWLPKSPELARAVLADEQAAPRLDDLIAEQETGLPAPTPEGVSDDE